MDKNSEIKIEEIYVGFDETFSIDGEKIGKRIYIPDANRLFYVYVVSSKESLTHEDLAEIFVKTNPKLYESFKIFREKTGNRSYKDFLVFECDAMAVADRYQYVDSKAEIILRNCDVISMKKILNEFLNQRYKATIVEPENNISKVKQ